jgi:hypothetical protein
LRAVREGKAHKLAFDRRALVGQLSVALRIPKTQSLDSPARTSPPEGGADGAPALSSNNTGQRAFQARGRFEVDGRQFRKRPS